MFKFIIVVITTGFLFYFAYTLVGNYNLKRQKDLKKQELIKQSSGQEEQKSDQENIFLEGPKDLNDCPGNLSGLFTEPIIKFEDLAYIEPLGALSPPGHTLPTNHIYWILTKEKETASKTPIYSPGDMYLVNISDVTIHFTPEETKRRGYGVRDDHGLISYICKGLSMNLGHLKTLSDNLEKIKETGIKNCTTTVSSKSMSEGKGIESVDNCSYELKYKIKAGELLGYSGGIDLGVFNQNKPLAYVNPFRYKSGRDFGDTLHGFCPIDLYSKDLRDKLTNIMGNLNLAKKYRTIEPRCGELMQDVPGTLQGNWFGTNDPQGGYENDGRMISLVHQSWDPSLGAISPGSIFMTETTEANHAPTFYPKHFGTINREFSEVRPGYLIYCYEQDMSDAPYGWPIYPYKYLIQLTDETHINIEKQKGPCSDSEKFNRPMTFER